MTEPWSIAASAIAGPPIVTAGLLLLRRRSIAGGVALRLGTGAVFLSFALSVAALAAALLWGEPGFDRLGAVMAVLVTLVSGVVHAYSIRCMAGEPELTRFAGWLGMATGASLALVLAQDVLVLAAAWIVAGAALVRLLGHVPGWAAAAASAGRAQRVFLWGDAALLAGVALLATAAGGTSLAGVSAPGTTLAGATLGPVPVLPLALGLIAIAAMTRSAIWPFHGWLLGSMNAPTPVSALMHAGMVNAGGFLIVRFGTLYAEVPWLLSALFLVGAATALLGTAVMLVTADVKRSLGASTAGQMGYMVMQCGLGGFSAAIYHLAVHGLFKATLFLGAGGVIDAKRSSHAHAVTPSRAPWQVPAALLAGLAAVALVCAITGHTTSDEAATTLLLGFIGLTAAQAALGVLRTTPGLGGLMTALAVALGGAAVYGIGLRAFEALLGGALKGGAALGLDALPAQPLGPLHVAVGGVFLALWLWNALGLALPAALHRRLYVALLTAAARRDGAGLTLVRSPV